MRRYLTYAAALLTCGAAFAADVYRKPPQAILDVLNAPVTPTAVFSPGRNAAILATGVRYPPLADVAQPMLRLAGLRISPATNGLHGASYYVKYVLKALPGGAETLIALPAGARAGSPLFSKDGKRFAFENTTPTGIELWVADTATARPRRIEGVRLNAAFGAALAWLPDNRTLRVQLVPAGRGKAPAEPLVPAGPNTQESFGKGAQVWTFEDLLKDPHDEDLFDYYATSQLALVDAVTGRITRVGAPAVFDSAAPSTDGRYLLIERVHRPYSYLYPARSFPRDLEVWDTAGKLVKKLASQPLADSVPNDGVLTGPRRHAWHTADPATLVWIEALDGGNPKNKVPFRDRIMLSKAPFTGAPVELARTEHRAQGIQWVENGGPALITEFNRERNWIRTLLADPARPGEAPRVVFSRSMREAYKNPGTPVTRTPVLSTGRGFGGGSAPVIQHNGCIYLSGRGASPAGERPFLDRLDLATLQTERLFQSAPKSYESFVMLLADDASSFITSRDSVTEPTNYYLRAAGQPQGKAITNFQDPTPQLRKITKRLVTYKRPDGVQLSFTLYLPPDYKEGTRLPTVVWAYPLEYTDASTAGQVTGSTDRFTTITGPSHLFFTLAGYAVLDNATMPVVGAPEVVNDTFVDQIVASAKAAIDKATELGVTDPNRVGVGGHSYGAFMTANLLAHSRLFRAGIARSGAYNRTLTPFGFQSERRTIWEAPQTYFKMSPFLYADKLKDPLLMIHGEADDNSGTFPIQSERMYAAVRGNGGNVRLVMLPYEAHSYRGKESVEHVLYEMISWFDKFVKDAPPR